MKITKDLGRGNIFREENMSSPRYGLGVRYYKNEPGWRFSTTQFVTLMTVVIIVGLFAIFFY